MGPSTNIEILGAIRDFWKVFSSANPASLADFYAPAAILFGVEGHRAEPARLALARRQREYFEHHARLNVDLGTIEVQWLSPNVALATYTLSFQASNVTVAGSQGRARQIPHGRATQVFQLAENGKALIIHEHFSSADIRKD
jgi:ketosteroid isomerase-like protein